jgi:hypothetical protein
VSFLFEAILGATGAQSAGQPGALQAWPCSAQSKAKTAACESMGKGDAIRPARMELVVFFLEYGVVAFGEGTLEFFQPAVSAADGPDGPGGGNAS